MTTHTPWRIHAYQQYWMPLPDLNAVGDWLEANHIDTMTVSVRGPITAAGGTITYRKFTADGETDTRTGLTVDPPDIDQPDVPHLDELAAVLADHERDVAPGPLLILGDTLDERHADIAPGDLICGGACRAQGGVTPWPCPPAAAAAARSGVTLS